MNTKHLQGYVRHFSDLNTKTRTIIVNPRDILGNKKTDIVLYGIDNPHLRLLATIRTDICHKCQDSALRLTRRLEKRSWGHCQSYQFDYRAHDNANGIYERLNLTVHPLTFYTLNSLHFCIQYIHYTFLQTISLITMMS